MKKLTTALTAATCSLLGTSPLLAASNTDSDGFEFDSTILLYSETDRVSAIEPVLSARKQFGEDQFLNLKFVFDALTGSSANGATAAAKSQTITKPSGNSVFVTDANKTPLDPSFRDTRVAISASWEQPFSRLTKATFGGNISKEFDYQSISANASVSHEFNKKNTTLSYGLSIASDTITPVGDTPVPLSVLALANDPATPDKNGNSETKTTTDLLLGVSQILSRSTIMQFNYSLGKSSGYHTDPYKILSVVDGTTGDNLAGPGSMDLFLHESRPDDRSKQSVYWQTKHHFKEDVVDVSYRYFWDDWGIKSHTVDFRYRFQFAESSSYLEPHLRFYSQDAADFFHHSLVDGQPTPQYATADYRLGELDTTTIGIKYGKTLANNQEFSMRLEFISQEGNSHPDDAIGSQRSQDLAPTVEALVIQASYSFTF